MRNRVFPVKNKHFSDLQSKNLGVLIKMLRINLWEECNYEVNHLLNLKIQKVSCGFHYK